MVNIDEEVLVSDISKCSEEELMKILYVIHPNRPLTSEVVNLLIDRGYITKDKKLRDLLVITLSTNLDLFLEVAESKLDKSLRDNYFTLPVISLSGFAFEELTDFIEIVICSNGLRLLDKLLFYIASGSVSFKVKLFYLKCCCSILLYNDNLSDKIILDHVIVLIKIAKLNHNSLWVKYKMCEFLSRMKFKESFDYLNFLKNYDDSTNIRMIASIAIDSLARLEKWFIYYSILTGGVRTWGQLFWITIT